jgi:hypothetical protein
MNEILRAPKTGFAQAAWEKVSQRKTSTTTRFLTVLFIVDLCRLFSKIQSKYDVAQAHEALQWISEMIGEQFNVDGDMDNVYEQLKDGRKLCQ